MDCCVDGQVQDSAWDGDARSWEAAEAAAATLGEAACWRARLAATLARASGVRVAGVYTCSVGYRYSYQEAVAPEVHTDFVRSYFRNRFQEIDRRDAGAVAQLRTFGTKAHAPLSLASNDLLRGQIRRNFLFPLGANGMLNAFLLDHQGSTLGWLCLATRDPDDEALACIGPPLTQVATIASVTLQRAIGLAVGCGLLVPSVAKAPQAALSARELEIVKLVAAGLTNLNIAGRLGISENTVGVHLVRIYRKLGVHSRVDLVGLLGAGER